MRVSLRKSLPKSRGCAVNVMEKAFSSDRAVSLFNIRMLSGEPFSWKDSDLVYEAFESLSDAVCTNVSEESIEDMIRFSESLGIAFEQMGRIKSSAECFTIQVELIARNKKLYGDDSMQMAGPLFRAIQSRNHYHDDDCPDLMKYAEEYMEDAFEEVFQSALSSRRVLRFDPVECSDAYLSVINDVEKILDEEKPARIWDRKKELLDERGIHWRTPAEMNPNVRF